MPVMDLPPPQYQQQIVCAIEAAVKYEIPANLMLAVVEKEGGKPGQWVLNSNGTHDVGSMQFNTAYLRDLARHGITANDVAADGCYPFDLAAWRLRGHIKNDKGDLWTRAANYHSRTPEHNAKYRLDLRAKAAKWADWLAARFVTVDITKPAAAPASTQIVASLASAEKPAARPARSSTEYVPRKLVAKD